MSVEVVLLSLHRRAAAADSLRAVLDVVTTEARVGLRLAWALALVRDGLTGEVICSVVDGDDELHQELLSAAATVVDDRPDRAVQLPSGDPLAPLLAAGRVEQATVTAIDGGGFLVLAGAGLDDTERGLVGEAVRAEVARAIRSDHARRRATYDVATGLPGPQLLDDVLNAAPPGEEVALLLVSVEQLQSVTRSFGRAVGSEMLRKVAARLLVAGGAGSWSVYRLPRGLGVLTVGPQGTAQRAAADIVAAMGQPWVLGRRSVRSTCRIGFAVRDPGQPGASLVERAEAALDAAGGQPGTDVVEYTPQLASTAHERLVLESLLHAGLAADELVLRFQPQVDIGTGTVLGAEALVRWQRPGGMVPPDRFIPAAEVTGLIVDVDLWVLRAACRQARDWPGLRVAVNVSSRTLATPDFAETVLAAVREAGIPASQLEVEITESLDLFEGDHAVAELTRLREHGVHVALDDFGTGYSNVGRLRHLPIDRVKIDQGFVRDIGAEGAGGICDVIVGLARALELEVIAEGVETEAQRLYLQQLGCPEFQGYLRSAPVAADEFAALLV